MKSRNRLLPSAVAVVAAFAVAVPALAAPGGSHKGGSHKQSAKLTAKGGVSFKVNRYTKDSNHWVPGAITIASGGTLTITNRSTGPEPHTFSIVQRSQLPRTPEQFENCEICNTIATAHGVNPAEPPHGPPPILTVDPKSDGFNEPGDSQFIGPNQTVQVKITAPKGTKLYFMCAIHPWMQGVVKVK